MRRPAGTIALGLGCVLMTGCGVWAQPEPVAIDIPVPSRSSPPEESMAPGDLTVHVYLLRGSRLERTPRPAPDASVATTLELLASGPTADETRSGLRTALAPGSVRAGAAEADLVVVDVTRELVATSGTDQLLAVAQVVWTVTEPPSTFRRVRLMGEEGAVEVPTDRGLSADPVTRDDFLSVAPETPPPSSPAD